MVVLGVGHDQIGDGENQVARSAIADRHLMSGAKTVEHRNAHAMEGYLQPSCRLAAMRMGHQEIAAPVAGQGFEVFQVADQHLLCRHPFQHRRLRRRHGRHDVAAHLMQERANIEQQVRFGADRHLAAAKVEMAIEHGVDQLPALPAIFQRRGTAGDLGKPGHHLVIGAETAEPFEQFCRRSGLFLHRLGGGAHLRADGRRPGGLPHGGDLVDAHAADGGRRELVGDMAVERAANVGQEDRAPARNLQKSYAIPRCRPASGGCPAGH